MMTTSARLFLWDALFSVVIMLAFLELSAIVIMHHMIKQLRGENERLWREKLGRSFLPRK